MTVDNPDTGPHTLVNTVVSSSPASSNCAAGSPGPACTATVPVADLTIRKTATPASVSTAGQVIGYSFAVTNTGQAPLDPVTVNDIQEPPAGPLSSGPACPQAPLAPGDTETCTAAYTVTQADVDNGSVNDSATATGSPPSGPAVTSPPSAASVPAVQGPAVTVAKSTTTATVTAAGQQVPYTFLVTNTGNVTLTGVTVTDTVTPPSDPANLSPVTCPGTTLVPGASVTCTATYTVTQADIDSGSVDDSATVTGTPPATPGNPNPVPLPPSPPSGASVPVAQAPALSVAKSAAPPQVHAPGDVISYQFLVTNTGNVTLAGVTVTDTQASPAGSLDGPVTCPDTTLAPGASTACTATYTVTQADIDNGSVDDSATASGAPPSGPAVTSPPSAASVPAAQAPALTVVKATATATVTRAGQQVPYSFLVTNTGNVTVHDVTVSDAVAAPSDPAGLSPVTCPDTTLAPGASVTCTATYTVTQADVDGGGSVDDSAAASGTPPSGPAVTSPPSTGSVPVAQSPAVTVAKSAVPAQVHAAGDVISYTFVVTNTGNVTLTSVAVTDAQAAPAGALDGPVSCPDTTLAPGASTSCTATYTVTQADIDSGSVDDAATASGTPPSGPAVTSPPSVVSVPVAQAPAIAVDKSAAPAQVHAAGDVISYTFVVTNTGNVTLHNVTVTDAQAAPAGALDAPVTCRGTTLAPGASTSCTATYTVTQADVDSGSVDDSATAAGTPPSGPAVTSAPSAASVPAVPAPDITVAKSTTTASVTRAGQQVPYTFTVTNTGNVTLHGVTVADTVAPPSDPAALSPVTCPDTTLAPGASTSCKATYTVSQADVDSGSVDDSATAAGTPPSGPAVTSAPSAASVPAVPAPDITVAKSTTTATVTHAGQQVPYMFVVTNAGNVTLTGVAVTDTVAPPSEQAGLSPVTCPDTTLAPGASVSCAATYTVTQADVDEGGPLRDSATATGTPPATPGNPSPVPLPPSLPSDESVPVTQVPVITVAKSTSTTTVTGAGQQVPYTFLVTNAGNVTLSGVTVTDRVAPPSEQAGLSPVTCPDTTLAPGASTSCTATYTVTQADVDGGGPLRDSATVTGTPPATSREPAPVPLPPSPPSGDSVPVAQSPALSVVKSAPSAQVHAAGDEIGYEFLVTNTGNVTLTSVAVTDTVAAPSDPANLSPVTCPDTTLAPGTSTTCTATYTLTVADVDNGSVNDTAAASGAPPSGPALTSAPSAASVPLPSGPAVTIVKSATPAQVHAAGELVTYRFTVTDTGNDTLHDVTVTDTQAPPAGSLDGPVTCPDTTLAPGASTTCTATYTVTQADIDHGQVNDTATATGTPPSGPPVTSPPVSVSALAAQAPAITVDKSAPAATVTHASQQLSYTFLVTNAGNVTLHDVTVTDVAEPPSNPAGLSPVTCPDSTLAPGASETCAATYTVTQADVDHGGPLSDSATVTGTPPPAPGNPSPPPLQGSPPSRASLPVAQAPRVSVVKSTAAAEVTQAGQQVRYSFLVTDTGNVTLHDVTVTDVVAPPSDPKDLSPLTCPRPALAPAESETCTATYTVTQADVDHGGPLRDSATATGTPPATAADPHPAPLPPSPPSGTSVRVAQAPALSVLKSAAPAQVHAPGDVIRYQFAVTNAGNVTLFRVSVPDPELAAASITVGCPASRLAPGASETCTPSRPYTVTGADIARGTVANTATATAVTPSGAVTRSRPSSVTVRVTPGGIVIPTGQGGNAPPAASPALAAAAGAALLAAGALLLMLVLRRRGCRHGT